MTVQLYNGIKDANYLFEEHLCCPLLVVYVDNLVQTYPKHATRDIIPATTQKIIIIIINSYVKQ